MSSCRDITITGVYDDDGNYINTSIELGDPILYGDGNANPLAFIDATDWTVNRYRIFGNAFVEIEPLPNLTIRTNLGTDILFRDETVFKERLSAAIYDPTSLTRGNSTDRTLIWNNTINYNFSLGASNAHSFNLLVGNEVLALAAHHDDRRLGQQLIVFAFHGSDAVLLLNGHERGLVAIGIDEAGVELVGLGPIGCEQVAQGQRQRVVAR